MGKVLKGNGERPFDPTRLELTSDRRVIPSELMEASEACREMLEEARLESEQIRKRAEKVLEEAVQEKEEERQKGFEQGCEEGKAKVTEQLAKVEADRERLFASHEKEILEMVSEIARKVVAREIEKGGVVDVIREALSRAVGERLTLRIHPDDKKWLAKRGDFSEVIGASRALSIETDESITPGGCLVETELATVDARLEKQWEAIQKVLGVKR